jgi:hypothetical protein
LAFKRLRSEFCEIIMHERLEGASRKVFLPWLNPARLSLSVYVATTFLSAGLLFSVEPMISKMALPRLGGTPNVWNACLFFFQAMLLVGYAYAHILVRRLVPRWQIGVHLALLVVICLLLPLKSITEPIRPDQQPVLWLLGWLTVTIGPAFFALAATTPLLQVWFSRIGHRDSHDPYFLYAASNLGSLLGLVAYPFAIEPYLALDQQSELWSEIFGVFAFGLVLCAATYLMQYPVNAPEQAVSTSRPRAGAGFERLRWATLAFVPSSLLLGITTHITTDIAAAPLFWVVPLALYLLTFVLVFARRQLLPHAVMVRLLPVAVIMTVTFGPLLQLPALVAFPLNLGCFFVIAMVFHGELASRRPEVDRLTEFYFFVSFGGVLGGLFNAILAPLLFSDVWELPLILVLACFLAPYGEPRSRFGIAGDLLLPAALFALLMVRRRLPVPDWQPIYLGIGLFTFYLIPALVMMSFRRRRLRFALGVAVCLITPVLMLSSQSSAKYRSFFGVYKIGTSDDGLARTLAHGTTMHGAASLVPGEEASPTVYYSRQGPFGRFFAKLASQDIRRVGIVGLGTGELGCYAKPGQQWTFYEIDPLVERIARDRNFFQFMARCGNEPTVVLGDARLTLERAGDGSYDVLVIDAFSSDSIPTHLLTKEALALYLKKLSARGAVLFHISNRYLDLAPVVAALAFDAGVQARFLSYQPEPGTPLWRSAAANVIALASAVGNLDFLTSDDGWTALPRPPAYALWTDQRSDILRSIQWLH